MVSNIFCVYKHTSPSGKVYIGITSRKPEYRWSNGKAYSNNKYFCNAINKYGWDNFSHIIIAKGLTEDEAKWIETQLIAAYDSTNREHGYNISTGGESGSGCIHTKEWRKQMSNRVRGENHPLLNACCIGRRKTCGGRRWVYLNGRILINFNHNKIYRKAV